MTHTPKRKSRIFFLKKSQRRVNSHNSKVKRNYKNLFSLVTWYKNVFTDFKKRKKIHEEGLNLQDFLFVVISFDIMASALTSFQEFYVISWALKNLRKSINFQYCRRWWIIRNDPLGTCEWDAMINDVLMQSNNELSFIT